MPEMKFLDCEIQMPLMSLPVRSVFIPLAKGGVLISPGTELTEEQLRSVSGVTDLVAPNLLHCEGIPLARKYFPLARVWGPKGALEAKPEIPWSDVLSLEAWPYRDELPIFEIRGMPNANEVVFLHRVSRTLLVCDLAFHLRHPKGLRAAILLRIFGTYKKFAVSRLFLKFVRDHEAFRSSMEEVFRQDFDNIVVSHGEELRGGAKETLRASLSARGVKVG